MLTPEELRETKLPKFTTSPEFTEELIKVVGEAAERINWEVQNYGGGFEVTGFPGLVNQTFNKVSRIWNYTIKGKRGRDKIRDEVDDFLNYALYLKTYYNMLEVHLGKDKLGSEESSDPGHAPDPGSD